MILTSIPNHLKKAEKTNGGKASTIKSRKKHRNTTEKIVQPRKHTRKTAQPPKHNRKNCRSTIFQPSEPPKPPTVEKVVEPISKRKLAWETTAEEGKTTIGAQHVHEFFNNLNTK
jgi:hypothetical protein